MIGLTTPVPSKVKQQLAYTLLEKETYRNTLGVAVLRFWILCPPPPLTSGCIMQVFLSCRASPGITTNTSGVQKLSWLNLEQVVLAEKKNEA